MNRPNLDRYVLCIIKEDIGALTINDMGDDSVSLKEGETWLLRYSTVRSLLAQGKVDLF